MLLVGRKRARAVSVPLVLSSFAALLVVWSVWQIGEATHSVWSWFSLALFVFVFGAVVSTVRSVRARGEEIVVRGPLVKARFVRDRCAIGIDLRVGSRGGASYELYLTDGRSREGIGTWSNQARAERARERLEAAILEQVPDASPVRTRVAATEAAWKEAQQRAEDQVKAYYRSPAWRRTGWVIVLAVVLYLLGFGIFFLVTGASP